MDELATWFERRILYGFGRHLWNISGISGVLAVFIGLLLMASSSGTVSASPKDYRQWLSSEKLKEPRVAEIIEYMGEANEELRKRDFELCVSQWQYSNAEYHCKQVGGPDQELASLMSQYESEYLAYKSKLDFDAENSNTEAKNVAQQASLYRHGDSE